MHYVYVIYSKSLDIFYIGESSSPDERLIQHNTGLYQGSFTKRISDWELKVIIPFKSITNARKAEIFIKKMKSKKFVEKLVGDYTWLIERFDI
jgi:putative endonuclease